jgi:thioester reductase-like protein
MLNIFITGGTGFLGAELIDVISKACPDCVIHALVRGSKKIKGRNIKNYSGDITRGNLGLGKNELNGLIGEIDVIYHCAGLTDINRPVSELRNVNVKGTKNVLEFATASKNKGRLKKVNHISTAYVAGTLGSKKCAVTEDGLSDKHNFNNNYEQSKHEGETCINEWRAKGLDIDIFRPSIVLGRFSDGKTTNFKMMYQPLHFFSMELFDRIPEPHYDVGNMINLDIAVKAIYKISSVSKNRNMNYHITSPKTVSLERFLSIACSYFGFRMPQLVPPEDFDMEKEYTPVKRKILEPYLPYFNYGTKFDMTNTSSALSGSNFTFPAFDDANFTRLFEYCSKVGFIRRKTHVAVG